jgi:hypothetical protein
MEHAMDEPARSKREMRPQHLQADDLLSSSASSAGVITEIAMAVVNLNAIFFYALE